MNIALAYNVRHYDPLQNREKAEAEAEFDSPETIKLIKNTLVGLGHRVFLVEADEAAYPKFKRLRPKIDLVFNYSEGIRGLDREAQIPTILEMLGIPHTGGSPLSYAIGLNKVKTKEVLAAHKILTPAWQVFKNYQEKISTHLKFPLIVKPQSEGSSKGIVVKSLVSDERQLRQRVKEEIQKYKQPALVEEFLDGREFTVGVLGHPPKLLPIVEIKFDELPKGMPKFDHYEAKWIYDNPKFKSDPLVCPAKISKKLEKQINDSVLLAFEVLELADWARFDIRLDKRGRPNILEVNCPPGIIPDPKENSRFPRAAKVAGLNFPKLLQTVIASASKRYKLKGMG